MIRFQPDTWLDALLRPIAMAAPNAGVYVEILAPDWRFALALAMALLVLIANWRRVRAGAASPAMALGAWLVVVFAIWLATTGNGRYFTPGLVAIGPICLALAYRLPGSRGARASAALLVVGLQLFALTNVSPWRSWELARWQKDSYFPVQLDEQARTQPSTYVGISRISYSLVAPQFPAESRWMNISALPDASETGSIDVQRAQKILAESETIHLFVPTRPDLMDADRNPTVALAKEIDIVLNGQRLALQRPLRCRLLTSDGALSMVSQPELASPQLKAKLGFWVCALRYPVDRHAPPAEEHPDIQAVLRLVEEQCPRFFPPGQKGMGRFEDAWARHYPESDIWLYVGDNGLVYYKYFRALNMTPLGQAADIRSGAAVECNQIRGRAGLPWEREI